jgi:hypothetical protein
MPGGVGGGASNDPAYPIFVHLEMWNTLSEP